MDAESLPLRAPSRPNRLFPTHLCIDPEQQTAGIPWLHGELARALPQQLRLRLRVHNKAGIPIVEGYLILEAGQHVFTIRELAALGIDGYAHAPAHERAKVGQRIWARRAYGMLLPVTDG
jgi:hypothetical protein